MIAPDEHDAARGYDGAADKRRVVVVGPCASGKSTLVDALRALGYDARASGQEHSEIPHLWRRQAPDVVIALAVDAETVSKRRGWSWPLWLHSLQCRRLAQAFASADLLIDTSQIDEKTVADRAETYLRRSRPIQAVDARRSGP